ncbi:hypothetical protein CDAR_531013 [Caerostris darwini]|uniref:Uncharacterized protein n=1 Tax=Caerostris darwini TaxID=1538125 RepID=A0AAV4VSW1_9ARAC|nr:hypothetical protein CDAR_531013 [Caerostris darwini]
MTHHVCCCEIPHMLLPGFIWQAVQSASEVKVNDKKQNVESPVPLSKQPARTQICATAGSPDVPVPVADMLSSQNKNELQQAENQSGLPCSQSISDQSKRIQDLSSSSSGGSTQHSLQQRAVVPDLSSLQLKLAQLTFPGSSIANDPGLSTCNVQPLPSSSQSLAPCCVSSMTTTSQDVDQFNPELPVIVTTVQMQTQMSSVNTSSIATPVTLPLVSASSQSAKASLAPSENISSRRHTVATNIEGLKLELQKIHTPSVPSVNLKSNIEQGLQAIFSISNTAQTVTTPAHSSAYNHSHQLSTSTPSLNTPTELCGSAAKSPMIVPPPSTNACNLHIDSVSKKSESLEIPSSSIVSRFKVTPVIENQTLQSVSVSDSVHNISLPIATTTSPELNVKKQGRFHITRVADEISTNLVQSSSNEDLYKKSSVFDNTNAEQFHFPTDKLYSQDQHVTGYAFPNIALQHSSSNPALMSTVPETTVSHTETGATNFTRSISDINVAEEQSLKLKNAVNGNFHDVTNFAVFEPIQDQNNTQVFLSNAHDADFNIKSSVVDCHDITGARHKDSMKAFSNVEYESNLSNAEMINKHQYAEKVRHPLICSTLSNEFEKKEFLVSENLPCSNQSIVLSNNIAIPSSFNIMPSSTLSSSLINASSDISKVPLNGFQASVHLLDAQKIHPCHSVSGTVGNISYSEILHPPSINHTAISGPDTFNKIPEVSQFTSGSHQVIQVQPSFLKDANANPLYCTYNSEDGKHLRLSQSEEENKNYEMLECNDEYLKVILERQEQERQELYRRHQQELQSYKMHHLKTHYGRKCCFHSKSPQIAVASSQTGNDTFSSYGSSIHHSKDQVAPESAVTLTANQNMHINNTGIVGYDVDQQAYMWSADVQQQAINSLPVGETIQAANVIVNKQSEFGNPASISQPESVSHLHCKDSNSQMLRGGILEMCSALPVRQHGIDLSIANISDPSLTKFTMPQLHVHDVHTNKNMAALNKISVVQRPLEVAPHSSPQTVRRIINATSAINVNPAYHHSPLISTSTSVSQHMSENEAYNGHSRVIKVSLPCSQSSDVIVSSPSKSLFPQSDS